MKENGKLLKAISSKITMQEYFRHSVLCLVEWQPLTPLLVDFEDLPYPWGGPIPPFWHQNDRK